MMRLLLLSWLVAWSAIADTAPVMEPATPPPSPATARALAKQGRLEEALAVMEACRRREDLTPTEQAELLFQTYQLYDPRIGLPRPADSKTQGANFAQSLKWLRQAAAVRDADRPTRWKILIELVKQCSLPDSPNKQTWAAEALDELEALPNLTEAERLALARYRIELAQLRSDYAALIAAVEQAIPLTTTLTERVRLQLRAADAASAFLKDKDRARALWRDVAANDQLHPYYRAVALEKLAHATLYREPLPNYLLAPFPERQAVPAEQTVCDQLPAALEYWQQALALPLANWVKLDLLTGMARAHESCGQPRAAYEILEQHALTLPALNRRQIAEIRFIMAQLALAAGERDRAARLAAEAATVPDARPQLIKAAQALTQRAIEEH
jgi:hypothetical protein